MNRKTGAIVTGASFGTVAMLFLTAYFLVNNEQLTNDLQNPPQFTDACSDFYKYSCRQWEEEHRLLNETKSMNTFSEAETNVNNYFMSIISDDTYSKHDPHLQAARTFYKSCLQTRTLQAFRSTYFHLIEEQFGKWDLMPSTSQNPNVPNIDDKDLTDLYLPLISNLGTSPLFSLEINPQTRSIDIYPGFLSADLNTDKDQIETLVHGFNFVLNKLGILELNKKKVNDAIELMKKLSAKIDNPELSPYEELQRPITLDELNSICPHIQWGPLLKEILGEAEYEDYEGLPITIGGKYELEVRCQQQDLEIGKQRRTFQTMVIMNFILEASKNMLLLSTSSSQTDLATGCIRRLQETFPWTLEKYYIPSHVNETHKKTLTDMFEEIKQTVSKLISENTWVDEAQRLYLLDKIQKVELFALYTNLDDSKKKEEISAIYKCRMEVGNYYSNELCVLKAQRLDQLRSNLFAFDVSLSSQPSFLPLAHYIPKTNLIHINAGIIQPRTFSEEDDIWSRFGSMGTTLGHEITHSIDSLGIYYDVSENYQDPEFYQTLANKILIKAQCFQRQYAAYGVKSDKIAKYAVVDELLADNFGLKTSFNTYRRLLMEQANHVSQDAHSIHEHDRTFFIKFAQNLCEHYPADVVDEYLENSEYVLGSDRVNGAVSNSKEFADAFSCPPDSPMNPQIKCGVW
uniref:Endothelin-converting enzyme 1 n=1 Tax=Schistosoma japonicum TaxID=6182 RepID=C1LJS8_SCHJA|nr:Endothelin-converting enzyme 1 [Schistosoma japonicum]